MTKGIYGYLAIAFGGAWFAWEIPIELGASVSSPLFQLAALPGAFAPAIAAIVVRKWITREGFRDAGLKFNIRKWPYYLVGWLLPIAVISVICLEAIWLGLGRPDFSLVSALKGLAVGRGMPANMPPMLGLIIVPQLMVAAIIATPILWGEEFGWRGYLQRRLFPDRPLFAAISTGFIWGVWHYPLILRGYDFPNHSVIGALIFPISTILLSIIFGWLRERSGSIWAASLAHSATNTVGGSLSLLWFYGAANPVLLSYVGVLAWGPLAALCAWIILTGQLKRAPPA